MGGFYSWYKKYQSFLGYVGITGIESADELARKGAERTQVGPEKIIGVTQEHVKHGKGDVFQRNSRRWREQAERFIQ